MGATSWQKMITESFEEKDRRFYSELSSYLDTSTLYIYGSGNIGNSVLNVLNRSRYAVKGYLDMKADQFSKDSESLVHHPESIKNKEDTLVIVSYLGGKEDYLKTKAYLSSLGYGKIVSYYNVYTHLYLNPDGESRFFHETGQTKHDFMSSLCRIGDALGDVKSEEVLAKFFDALIHSDSGKFSAPDPTPQYFPKDIPFSKGYGKFIDCGAFTGDTALSLLDHYGVVEKIAFFEPEAINFTQLARVTRENKIAAEQTLFPCGVWDKTEILRFSTDTQAAASKIDTQGSHYVQCVALDDVIADFEPTFIKMDIEGSEYNALMGAETLIEKNRPDLAISVYHKIEHMWEIPLFILKMNPCYKLYFRCYDAYGMETILYASDRKLP